MVAEIVHLIIKLDWFAVRFLAFVIIFKVKSNKVGSLCDPTLLCVVTSDHVVAEVRFPGAGFDVKIQNFKEHMHGSHSHRDLNGLHVHTDGVSTTLALDLFQPDKHVTL